MNRIRSRPVSSLLLALALCAAGATPSIAAATTSATLAVRVTQALDQLTATSAQLGLGQQDGFAVTNAFVNGQDQAIVRFDQTYAGQRVWGGQAIAHVLPDGTVRSLTSGVQPGILLPGAPILSAAQAIQVAVRRLAPVGQLSAAPDAELVAFPLAFALAPRLEADLPGGPTFQEVRDVVSRLSPGQAHVWAYEVTTRVSNPADGFKEMTYLVEGNTGAVLLAFDKLQSVAAGPSPFAGPAVGTGLGFYRGTVSLDATRLADGSYVLWDTTRGTVANKRVGWGQLGWYPFVDIGDTTTQWSYRSPGIAVLAAEDDGPLINPYSFGVNPWPFFSPTGTWGDGLAWLGTYTNERTVNAQTLGVDTMSALETTFDFYKNVLGYSGWDGAGTSIYALAGYTNMDNAFWDPNWTGMFVGGGSYPANPNGLSPMTDLDVVSHEYGHAISNKVGLIDRAGYYEDGALSEGTSDIFAQMVMTWAGRAPGAPAGAVPATGATWEIGRGVGRGTPFRWLDQPSRDGVSPEHWYDGLQYMDPHYQMGVVSRFFYFLSQGASSTPGDPHYSPYLPGGMTGIGNDAALRIWFKTVTERLTRAGTLDGARAASILAATDLVSAGTLPAGSVEALENAWAAVNVGSAPGAPPRLRVRFPTTSPYLDKIGLLRKVLIVPAGEPAQLQVQVENGADTRVDWSIGGPSRFAGDYYNLAGGKLEAGGRWTAPLNDLWSSSRSQPHLYRMTATSAADPLQYADGLIFAAYIDTDGDGERDALDLAGVAFSWRISSALALSHPVFPGSAYVDDWDVAAIVEAIKNAWPVK